MSTQQSEELKKKGTFRNKKKILASLGTVLGFICTLLFPAGKDGAEYSSFSIVPLPHSPKVVLGDFPVWVPTVKYGFIWEQYEVKEGIVEPNQTFGKLLSDSGIGYPVVDKLVKNADGVFNFTSDFRVKKPYFLLTDKKTGQLSHLVFEPNVYEYVVFNLNGDLQVKRIVKEIETRRETVAGEISSTFWEALTEQGIGFDAASKMEDALQWSVDFSHTQKGDLFRMIYDKKFIEDKDVGAGQVYAAYYKREGKESYAIWFDNGEYKGFYDLEGRAIKSSFLKAPVKYTRISSRYNKRRFHPILKRVRPHLGTDYAAPYGTPIYAVGNGVVVEAAYTKGNGRYVKIKHDDVYQTQYLHMSKFANGIKRGVQVAQGEVIGYVGSSGLATGPHVCFRFWKNGKQVNHLRENLPAPKPLPEEVLPAFFEVRDQYLEELLKLGNASEKLADSGDNVEEKKEGASLP